MGQRLSVAMIVRNEAQLLPGCLESIAPVADEICVVDTGSRDGTLSIARDFGCRTAQFTWEDDFSSARNASLNLCQGDWVLVLDADERLDGDAGPQLRELLEAGTDRAYRFTTRNYTNHAQVGEFVHALPGDAHARGFAGWFPSVKVRLFPRDPGIRFEHRVHEVVTPSLLRLGFAVICCAIPVHHYPLLKAPEEIRRKQERYLALGKAKLAEQPESAQAHAELGSQYLELGELPSAAQSFREAVRRAPDNAIYLKDLGGALFLIGRIEEAERALRLAVAQDPALADAWRNLGVVVAQRAAWREALDCFDRALLLLPGHPQLVACREEALLHLPGVGPPAPL